MNYTSSVRFPYFMPPYNYYCLLAPYYRSVMESAFAHNYRIAPYHLPTNQSIFIPSHQSVLSNSKQSQCVSKKAVDLMNDNRSLWEEHVAWTRMAIISLTFHLPDVEFVIARLLQNATDMGEMLRPIYGEEAGDEYADLIKEHLLVAADLVNAAIANDEQTAIDAEQKWYENADEIATFLNRVNQFLPENEVRKMFYEHLDLTKQEAILMIQGEYEKDVAVYDDIEKQAREMADMISEAMITLYPDIYACPC